MEPEAEGEPGEVRVAQGVADGLDLPAAVKLPDDVRDEEGADGDLDEDDDEFGEAASPLSQSSR